MYCHCQNISISKRKDVGRGTLISSLISLRFFFCFRVTSPYGTDGQTDRDGQRVVTVECTVRYYALTAIKQAAKAVTAACMDGNDCRAVLITCSSVSKQKLAAFNSPSWRHGRGRHVEMNVGRRRPVIIFVTSTNIIVTSIPNRNAPVAVKSSRDRYVIYRSWEDVRTMTIIIADLSSLRIEQLFKCVSSLAHF